MMSTPREHGQVMNFYRQAREKLEQAEARATNDPVMRDVISGLVSLVMALEEDSQRQDPLHGGKGSA